MTDVLVACVVGVPSGHFPSFPHAPTPKIRLGGRRGEGTNGGPANAYLWFGIWR